MQKKIQGYASKSNRICGNVCKRICKATWACFEGTILLYSCVSSTTSVNAVSTTLRNHTGYAYSKIAICMENVVPIIFMISSPRQHRTAPRKR